MRSQITVMASHKERRYPIADARAMPMEREKSLSQRPCTGIGGHLKGIRVHIPKSFQVSACF
jgi:hypothetical protein